ncbi:hypothetical protein HZW80_001943 [Salmonella enterica]|nr:hypothetical protein [Salmonella enterica]EFS7044663.1 hypothetical protein [Salmonella enterica]EGF3098371.1 hypothetical protein [Salmonella enterica]EID5669699.1 hypothetical protein [Salmonella enterica]EIK9869734.1 hypothetical protein [Salmonella enterica]
MTVHDAISKRKRLIGQFHLFIKPASAGFLLLQGDRMNDCPRRYVQKKAAYRSVSPLHKTRFGGFLLLQGGRMNDCPRRYIQKKAAYRSVSPLHKTRFGGFLLIRPVKGIEVAEDASVTIRQLIDSRGDIILFVFVMRNTKRYRLRSF